MLKLAFSASPAPRRSGRITRLAGLFSLAVFSALLTASPAALAQRHWHGGGGANFSLNFGVPFGYYGPRYYGPRYYYDYPPSYYYPPSYVYAPPPAVIVERAPPVYVQREDLAPAPAEYAAPPAVQASEPVWWYWCAGAGKYYPYVMTCPGGFQRVPPQPMPQNPPAN